MKKIVARKDAYLVVNKYGDFKIFGEIAKSGKTWLAWDADTEETKEYKTLAEAENYFLNKIAA